MLWFEVKGGTESGRKLMNSIQVRARGGAVLTTWLTTYLLAYYHAHHWPTTMLIIAHAVTF